jgi:hypothetical protein
MRMKSARRASTRPQQGERAGRLPARRARPAQKSPTNLSLRVGLVRRAKTLGLNLSESSRAHSRPPSSRRSASVGSQTTRLPSTSTTPSYTTTACSATIYVSSDAASQFRCRNLTCSATPAWDLPARRGRPGRPSREAVHACGRAPGGTHPLRGDTSDALTPVMTILDDDYVAVFPLVAAVPRSSLAALVGSLAAQRITLVAAFDLLLTGS